MNWRFWSRQTRPQPDTCTSLEPLLSLFSDGMASPSESRRVEAHLADCPECRRTLEWMQVTRQVIARRPVAVPPADLRMRIAQAIAAEAAADTAFRPAPRSFVTRPAFAMAASVALAAALTLHYAYQPHPSGILSPTLPAPIRTATHTNTTPVKEQSGKTTLPFPAKPPKILTAKKVSHSPLPPALVVRPHTDTHVAQLPDTAVEHAPQDSVMTVVQSHLVTPRVKVHPPTTSVVAIQPPKVVSPHVIPLSVKRGPDVVATLPKTTPLHSEQGAVLAPLPTSDTTNIVQPKPVPVQVATVSIPSVVHENALNRELSTMVAFRTDHSIRHVELDKNAHVQMTAYSPNGQDKFVQAPAVYTPGFNDKVNKQMAMASESTTK